MMLIKKIYCFTTNTFQKNVYNIFYTIEINSGVYTTEEINVNIASLKEKPVFLKR